MVTRFEITNRPDFVDPRGEQTARGIRSFLGVPVQGVRSCDVYHVEAELSPNETERVLHELVDPVLQRGALGCLDQEPFDVAVAVGYKPGVTDSVGKSARVAIEDMLGRELGSDAAVYSSRLYLIRGIDRVEARRIATELLANPVIQTIRICTSEEWQSAPPDLTVPRVSQRPVPEVRDVDLSGDDDELVRTSREGLLALSLDEMRTIRDHFGHLEDDPRRRQVGLSGRPTDVELECLAQTWSEHCKHKIFNATD